jgi:hypothetical protein
VPSVDIEKQIFEQLEKKDVIPIGTIFLNTKISESNLLGNVPDDSKAKDEIRCIIRCLLDLTIEKTNNTANA